MRAYHDTGGQRTAISNIAWPAEVDEEALDLIAGLGFEGVELAPGKAFGDLAVVPLDRVTDYRSRVEARGLSVCALQAILFGVKDAHLFRDGAARQRMAEHLRRIAEIAGTLGACACVFGAPTLRDPGELSSTESLAIAGEFFASIAPDFAAAGTALCVEANPPLYQCRFLTRTEEAFDFVRDLDLPGLALQLDTGTIFMNGEDPAVVERVAGRIGHAHVSEPELAPVGAGRVDHTLIAEALGRSSYRGWLSVEMKAAPDWREAVRTAWALVMGTYRERLSGREHESDHPLGVGGAGAPSDGARAEEQRLRAGHPGDQRR